LLHWIVLVDSGKVRNKNSRKRDLPQPACDPFDKEPSPEKEKSGKTAQQYSKLSNGAPGSHESEKKKEIKANNLVLSRKREATPHHAQPKLCPRLLPLPPFTVPEQLITIENKEGGFSKELNRAGPFTTERIPLR
jgi:hypothetical protein